MHVHITLGPPLALPCYNLGSALFRNPAVMLHAGKMLITLGRALSCPLHQRITILYSTHAAKLPFSHVSSQTCKHHVKASQFKQSSHIHSEDGPASASIQAPEKVSCALLQPLEPSVLSQQNAPKQRSQDAVQHTCNANDLPFASAWESKGKCFEALLPSTLSLAPQLSARCELLHRKVALLELEQVSLCDASTLRKSRAFKSTSFKHLAAVLKLLKELLGSGEKACRSLAMNPGFLSQRRSELLEQKLKVLADFGIIEKTVRKLCTTSDIWPRKVDSLHKTLSLLEEIGLTVAARNKILRENPRILHTREGSILHTLDFFKNLGMSGKEIKRSLCRQPALLMRSVDHLREKYNFIQQLGFTVNEFRRLTSAGMPLLAIETVQAKIKTLKDLGFSDSDVHVLVLRNPSILALTYEALKSKLDFLRCEQNYGIADIVKFPVCLTCSLQGRLIPRFKALKEKGLSKVYALSTILACSDLKFQEIGRGKRGGRAVFSG